MIFLTASEFTCISVFGMFSRSAARASLGNMLGTASNDMTAASEADLPMLSLSS